MAYENNDLGKELGWDDEITKDGGGFVLLPEGKYPFTVEKFERGRHAGSAKLPPCNKAVLTIRISDPTSGLDTTVEHNLFLHSRTEGLLSQFFVAVGMKKPGEPTRMNFPGTIGRSGQCMVGVRSWTGNDGREHQANQIQKFLDPADEPKQTAMELPTPNGRSWRL